MSPSSTDYKNNIDQQAINMKAGKIGMGSIHRNFDGMVVGADHTWLSLHHSVAAPETKTILLGIKLVVDLKIDKFSIESNNLQVTQLLRKNEEALHEFAAVLNDVKRQLVRSENYIMLNGLEILDSSFC